MIPNVGKRTQRPKQIILTRLGITLVCLILVLILFEVFLRQAYTHITLEGRDGKGHVLETTPEFLYQHTPKGKRLLPNSRVKIHNHYLSHRDVIVHTNAFGFRAEEIKLEKEANEIRILVLGDSITVADSLNIEDVFTSRLEHELKSIWPSKTLRVINAGTGNIGTREELDIFEERGLALNPDWVVVAFYLNDSRPSWGFSEEAGHRGWLRRHSLIVEAIYQRVLLSRWIKKTGPEALQWIGADKKLNWAHEPEEFMKLVKLARYDWGAAWEESSWETIHREFQRLSELSQAKRISVLIAAFPVSFQVYADFIEDQPQKKIGQISAEFRFQYIDLLPALRAGKDSKLFFDQCHLTPEGHQLVAQELSKFFRAALNH